MTSGGARDQRNWVRNCGKSIKRTANYFSKKTSIMKMNATKKWKQVSGCLHVFTSSLSGKETLHLKQLLR
jgi:hypothetical protein